MKFFSALPFKSWKAAGLQLYRLAVLVVIVAIMRDHQVRLRVDGDLPLSVDEVKGFYPTAKELRPDYSERKGSHVLDANGKELGYVVRTSPVSDFITGYVGPTDTIVAMDNQLKVLGIKIRRSEDTKTHVADVGSDRYFMKTWNNKNWDQIAAMDIKKEGIEGVSGATMTSMAMAESITYRFKSASEQLSKAQKFRYGSRDIGLLVVVVLAGLMAFTHMSGRKWMRRTFQVSVIVYVGFINGDLVAQSLLHGWAKSGVPWNVAPGLVLLVAAALIVPWATRRPLYCLHICPHGAAQELCGRLLPSKYRLKVSPFLAAKLKWIPPTLLLIALLTTMLVLPIDLASIEPFDAYIIKSAGWATLAIAVIGLMASLFVPQAYCKFGCPTGALLEFVRTEGTQDRFGKGDWFAGLLVLMVALVYWKYAVINTWITGPL